MSKSLEERGSNVEQEIERLKRQLKSRKDKSNWISDIAGSFEGDVDFDEILRLGREERQKNTISETD